MPVRPNGICRRLTSRLGCSISRSASTALEASHALAPPNITRAVVSSSSETQCRAVINHRGAIATPEQVPKSMRGPTVVVNSIRTMASASAGVSERKVSSALPPTMQATLPPTGALLPSGSEAQPTIESAQTRMLERDDRTTASIAQPQGQYRATCVPALPHPQMPGLAREAHPDKTRPDTAHADGSHVRWMCVSGCGTPGPASMKELLAISHTNES
jgi:hypothetical protein